MKNIISKKLLAILANRGWSVLSFAQKCYEKGEVSIDTVKSICYGRINNPRIETLAVMADILDISIDTLIGRLKYAEDKRKLLNNYDACPPSDKILVQEFAERGKNHAAFANEQEHKYIVSCIIPTGYFSRDGMLWDSAIVIDEQTFYSNVDFAVKLPTNTYVPVYDNNETLYVEHRSPINEDEAVILYKNDKFFIRRIKYNHESKSYILKALTNGQNDIYEKTLKEYHIMGTILSPERCTRDTSKDGKIKVTLPLDIQEIVDKFQNKKEPN